MRRLFCLGMVVLAGCQVTDFEPRGPLHSQSRSIAVSGNASNVVLLVDRSASMRLPTRTGAEGCPTGCGQVGHPDCPVGCPTRWSENLAGLLFAIDAMDWHTRVSLVVAPGDGVCGLGRYELKTPDARDAVQQRALNRLVRDRLESLRPVEGTARWAATLTALAREPELTSPEHDDFVVLASDGADDCDAWAGGVCRRPEPVPCAADASAPLLGPVEALRRANVKTVLIRPPGDADRSGLLDWHEAAITGGLAANACFGCADGVAFYSPSALQPVFDILEGDDVCLWHLDFPLPTDWRHYAVRFNGVRVFQGPSTFEVVPEGLRFVGAACDEINRSRVDAHVNLEVVVFVP